MSSSEPVCYGSDPEYSEAELAEMEERRAANNCNTGYRKQSSNN